MERQRSVVGLDDAFDDCQAQAETGMVAADALGSALKRLGQRRDQLRTEPVAGVLHGERDLTG
jgi:hypothetical protein